MSNFVSKNFKGNQIDTFLWNGKPCWIAFQISEILGYENKSKPVNTCLKVEKFELGYEYEVLSGEELKSFKDGMENELSREIKFSG